MCASLDTRGSEAKYQYLWYEILEVSLLKKKSVDSFDELDKAAETLYDKSSANGRLVLKSNADMEEHLLTVAIDWNGWKLQHSSLDLKTR